MIKINAKQRKVLLGAVVFVVAGLLCCHKGPHSVTLTWNAPRPSPGVTVVGYNIYRSTTPGERYVRLASRVAGSPYEDRLVVSGRTYFYVVTAVDQAGRESPHSVEARATIP